jgi:hypothetical protein
VTTLVSWTASSGATSYEIYHSTSTTNPTSGTAATVTGITNTFWEYPSSDFRYYWVRARNSGGVSAYSSRVTPTDQSFC